MRSIVVIHDLDGIEVGTDEATHGKVSWLEDILEADYPQANILTFCPIADAVGETLFTGSGLQAQARELLATVQEQRKKEKVC